MGEGGREGGRKGEREGWMGERGGVQFDAGKDVV